MEDLGTPKLRGARSAEFESRLAALPQNRQRLALALLSELGLVAKRGSISGCHPASFEQEGLWLNQQIPGNRLAYNEAIAIRIEGSLCTRTLELSLGEIVDRHHVLRTTFQYSGERLLQSIHTCAPPRLNLEAAIGLSATMIEERIGLEVRRPFDLEVGPLWRNLLLNTGSNVHLLLIVLHHIVADGYSLRVFWDELLSLYGAFASGKSSPLSPLGLQYSDYAYRQRETLTSTEMNRLLTLRLDHLQGIPRYPAPERRESCATRPGGHQSITLSSALTAEVEQMARAQNCSAFMVLLAAWGMLLECESETQIAGIASDFTLRKHPAFVPLIGFFVNQVVLRLDLSGGPDFHTLVDRVREEALCAYQHHELPYAMLAAATVERNGGEPAALFSTKMVWHDSKPARAAAAGLEWELVNVRNGEAKFDLLINLWGGSAIEASLDFALDRYKAEEIILLAQRFRALLSVVTHDPGVPLSRLRNLVEIEVRESRNTFRAEARSANREKLLLHQRGGNSWLRE